MTVFYFSFNYYLIDCVCFFIMKAKTVTSHQLSKTGRIWLKLIYATVLFMSYWNIDIQNVAMANYHSVYVIGSSMCVIFLGLLKYNYSDYLRACNEGCGFDSHTRANVCSGSGCCNKWVYKKTKKYKKKHKIIKVKKI